MSTFVIEFEVETDRKLDEDDLEKLCHRLEM